MPAIVDEHGKELEGACEGLLVMPTGYLLNFLSMQQQNDIMMVVYSYNAACFHFEGDETTLARHGKNYLWRS